MTTNPNQPKAPTHLAMNELVRNAALYVLDGHRLAEALRYVAAAEANEARLAKLEAGLDAFINVQETSGVENERDLWFFFRKQKERIAELGREVATLRERANNPCRCEFGEYGWIKSECPVHG